MNNSAAATPEVSEKIVIVGGGFAGVTLAQRLERLLPERTEIIVLSADNHLVFTPHAPGSRRADHLSPACRCGGPTVDPPHEMAGGARQPD